MAYARVLDSLRTFAHHTLRVTEWFPATPMMTLFIIDLLDQGKAPASVLSSLSAIAFAHKLYDFPDPTTHFIIRKIIQDASKLHPQVDMRAPITPSILAKLCDSLSSLPITRYHVILFRAMFTHIFMPSSVLAKLLLRIITFTGQRSKFSPVPFISSSKNLSITLVLL